MDAFERCLQKLDDMSHTCDDIVKDLRDFSREQRRRHTSFMLIILVLWGIGWPAAFLISVVLMRY